MARCFPERCLGAALLLLAFGAAAQTAPDPRIAIVEPRPFGYTIGDVLEREIRVEIDSRYTLDREQLPRARRLDAWLEARAPSVDEAARPGMRRYLVTLAYQVVGSPESVRTLMLPEVRLVFSAGGESLSETVPEWPVTAGPLTPAHVLGRAGLDELRPDRGPAPVATRPIALRLGVYAVIAAVLLLYLGYRRFGLAWPGRSGPFARAYRDLVRLRAGAHDARAYRTALRRLHRAFDETARRTVFAGELAEFFASHPRFAPLRPATESFFESSRLEFFGEGRAREDMADVLALCREYRRRERGGR